MDLLTLIALLVPLIKFWIIYGRKTSQSIDRLIQHVVLANIFLFRIKYLQLETPFFHRFLCLQWDPSQTKKLTIKTVPISILPLVNFIFCQWRTDYSHKMHKNNICHKMMASLFKKKYFNFLKYYWKTKDLHKLKKKILKRFLTLKLDALSLNSVRNSLFSNRRYFWPEKYDASYISI